MRLDTDDIVGIISALAHTICLDNEAGQDELVFLDEFLEKVGVGPDERDALIHKTRSCQEVDSLVQQIKSRPARIYALQQALLLALSDGDYRKVERAGLQNLAERFGIDEVLFEELERWALEGAGWQIKGAALLAR